MQTLVDLFGGRANYRHYRPSPYTSATAKRVGSIMTGHDKKLWIVTRTKNGIHRWVHLKTSKRRSRKRISRKRQSNKRRSLKRMSKRRSKK